MGVVDSMGVPLFMLQEGNIICGGTFPQSDIPSDFLKCMKTEFECWYLSDLRVSGKDFIQNHLTFCIYNHIAILPEEKWVCLFRCNWHLIFEKMSKSTGNFKNLRQAIEVFLFDVEQAQIVEATEPIAVVTTKETPMRPGAEEITIGVNRLTDPGVVYGIEKSVNILVISRARIEYFIEAQILEAVDVDFIDETKILSQEMTKVIARILDAPVC
ncbi:hypothetical protein SUGI_0958330 [Cryptomeria japonica]|nr:hypothetical protein SUGI_0958330 [Cryptomeria japonica]